MFNSIWRGYFGGVRKVAKFFLAAAAAAFLLVALAFLGVNLYVQSAAIQRKIEDKISAEIHLPVRIGGANFTPWSGFTITGIAIPQSEGQVGENFFQASSFRASMRLAPLWRRELVFNRIKIESPQIAWIQNDMGKWTLPETQTQPPAEPAGTGSAPTFSITPTPLPELQATTPMPERAARRLPPYAVSLQKLVVTDGRFEFFDHGKALIASFGNVQAKGSFVQHTITGVARCAKASIHDAFFLENLRTPFSYSAESLSLSGLRADFASGTVAGNFSTQPQAEGAPFELQVTFSKTDINRIISEAGGPFGQATGLLDGSLALKGKTHDMRTARGTGHLSVANGWVRQYEIFQQIGQYLRIEELSELSLERADTDFHVADGRVVVDQLTLQSPNLNVLAKGKIRFDGKLDLDARLTINPKISHRLPDFIEKNFTRVENSDQRYVDFDITGTVQKPKTNLRERILGRKLREQVVDFLQGFMKPRKLET
ncbi:MAG: type II secretion system protein GspN, partial [Verrucomicrobiota bacterium]|nr:type II secretion system protein GspN [Verrucomicrobiota bacterium]